MLMTSTLETNVLTSGLLQQGCQCHRLSGALYKYYHQHSGLIVKYTICLKSLLQQGIQDPVFYGDLVQKFKRIVGVSSLSDQFKTII